MNAMILSAGLGVRMRPLTDSTPKALLKAGPHRLIEHHLFKLANAGFLNVVINTSYLAEQFQHRLGDGSRYGVQIRYSHEGTTPLETGGGIVKALPLIGSDPFLIVNADVFSDFEFHDLHCPDNADGCLVVVNNPTHHPHGDFVLNNEILRIPTPDEQCDSFTYSGIAVLRKSLFDAPQKEIFPLYDVFRTSISRGRLAGQFHDGEWFDIGTPERLQQLNSVLQTD